MARYKCIIAYDGTEYAGWQVQPNGSAVTSILEKTFKRVFETSVKITGASRTDAGVHAVGQVASFTTDLPLDTATIKRAWNNSLPESIVIRRLEQTSDEFAPRSGVAQKIYWYHFFLERPLPFVARYGYYHRRALDLEKLNRALQLFVGTHDFRSFTNDQRENTVRTIDAISLDYLRRYRTHRITVKGRSFLRFMIRRIVGACLKVASDEELSTDFLQQVLDEKNAHQWLPKAPAQGLVLYKIWYRK